MAPISYGEKYEDRKNEDQENRSADFFGYLSFVFH